MTDKNDSWTSPFESLVDRSQTTLGANIDPSATQQPGSMIGTPDQDTTQWDGQQTYQDDCAIRSQQFIIEQFTGQKLDETALVQEAQAHGWYTPGQGTPMQDVGNELELHGIPVNHYDHANVYDLANQLAQGHKVIIGVDAGELWQHKPDGAADHAVVVSGIDTSDPNNPQVIVSDPGTGQAEAHYPMDQFLTAWQASNFSMVATQQPAPPHVPGMQNFDYGTGHIGQVAGMPYDQFQALHDQPGAFEHYLDGLQSVTGAALSPETIFHDANPSLYPPTWDGWSTHDFHDAYDVPAGGGHDHTADSWHMGSADPNWDLGAQWDLQDHHALDTDTHFDPGA